MKTSYFKSGILAAAAALLCAATTVSCKDDIYVGEWNGSAPIEGGMAGTGATISDGETNQAENSVELWSESYSTDVKLHLTRVPEGFKATAAFDAAYLEEYNAANHTDYLLYPADKVLFENEGAFTAVAGGEFKVGMAVSAAEDLEVGKTYMIPVAVTASGVTFKQTHCVYLMQDMRSLPNCHKGEDMAKGFLFFEVNDVNPLNALSFELENGKLLWDVICLFSGNINHHSERNAPYLKCNPQVQFLLDNNETYLQPLRKRGMKVVMGVLGNHDQAGVAQLSALGARVFAEDMANVCEVYNLDGVCFDDEYSTGPDLTNPCYTNRSTAAAARLCYETRQRMPDKLIVAYCYGSFSIYSFPEEVEGSDISEWVDIAVADYGGTSAPKGKMTWSQCSGISMEFNRGSGGNFNSSAGQRMLDKGYGWFMGFAPDPLKRADGSDIVIKNHWQDIFNRMKGGPETIYGSGLKDPTTFYFFADPKPYKYPEDLPNRYTRPEV
ncbi:BT_3987 domain-containing protein [Alistipes sp.]|uniref:BT_3987 domain-containing protein n=1 Tax=Alistipes sp. TaxID=1872444 RepID=UPI003AEF5774